MLKKVDVAELVNNSEFAIGALELLNEKCKEIGISPDSDFYKKRKEEIILITIYREEKIRDAFAKNVYHGIHKELK